MLHPFPARYTMISCDTVCSLKGNLTLRRQGMDEQGIFFSEQTIAKKEAMDWSHLITINLRYINKSTARQGIIPSMIQTGGAKSMQESPDVHCKFQSHLNVCTKYQADSCYASSLKVMVPSVIFDPCFNSVTPKLKMAISKWVTHST